MELVGGGGSEADGVDVELCSTDGGLDGRRKVSVGDEGIGTCICSLARSDWDQMLAIEHVRETYFSQFRRRVFLTLHGAGGGRADGYSCGEVWGKLAMGRQARYR